MYREENYRALLVKKKPESLRSVRIALEKDGRFDLDFATNWGELLEKLQKDPYDLVSFGIDISDDDLEGLLKEIRALNPKILVMFLKFRAENSSTPKEFERKETEIVITDENAKMLPEIFTSRITEYQQQTQEEKATALQKRATDLKKRVPSAGGHMPEGPENFEEMSTILEEVRRAAAELNEQNRDLAALHQKLEEMCHHHRDIFKPAHDAYLETDSKSAIKDVNHAAEELLQASRDELIGETLKSFAKDPQDFCAHLSKLQTQKGIQSWEVVFQSRKETRIDTEVIAAAMPESKEGVFTFCWILHDVSQREQMRAALAEKEEKLNLAIEGADLGIWNWDLLTDEVTHNQKYMKMMGHFPGDTKSDLATWKRLVHPDDLQKVEKVIQSILERKTHHLEMAYRLKSENGTWRWIHDKGKVVSWDEAGRPIKMAGVMKDVTERRDMKKALQRSEERLNQAIEGADLGIWEWNTQTGEASLNDRCVEMIGCASKETDTEGWMLRIHPEDRPHVGEALQAHLDGKTSQFETRYRLNSKNGKWTWVHSLGNTICQDEAGRPLKIAGIMKNISDQKELEEKLERSEERYRAIVEDQTELIGGSLPDGTITFVNDAYCRYFDKRQEDLVGQNFMLFIPEEDQKTVREGISHLTPQDPIMTREHRSILPDGEIRWQQWNNRARFDEKGRVAEILAVGRDITERKLMEDTLKKNEDRLNRAIKGANLGTWDYDLMTGELAGSARFAEMHGSAPEELAAHLETWLQRIHPKDVPKVDRAIQDCLCGKILHFEVEYRLKSDDERCRWISSNGEIVARDENGQPLKIAGIAQDITDRKNTEEVLRHTHHQMMNIVEQLPDATFVIDKNKNVIAWNRAIEEMTGVSKEEIIGKGEYSYAVPAYKAERPSLADFVFSGEIDADHDYDCIEKEENTFFAERFIESLYGGKGAYVWIKASPIFDDDGNVAGVIQSIRDITERKKAEEELRRSHHRMENIIEHLPDATIVLDEDMKVVAWNQEHELMTGIPKEDAIGKSSRSCALSIYGDERPMLADLIFSDNQELEKLYDYVKKEGDTFFAETFVPSLHGGKGAYIWIKASPLFNDEGKITGAIQSIRDITDRKKAEQKLRSAHDLMEKIVEHFPDATVVFDKDMKIVAWNRAIEVMTGVSKEDAIGKSNHDCAMSVYGFERPILSNFIVSDSGDIETQYDRVEKRDNTIFAETFVPGLCGEKGAYVWIKASPLLDGGQVKGAIQSIRDITDRKEAEQKLRCAHRRMANIIEHLPDATVVFDENMKVIAWNRAIEEMTRIQKKDAIGKSSHDCAISIHGFERDLLADLILSENEDQEAQYDHIERNEGMIFAELFVPSLYGGKGAQIWIKASPLLDEGEVKGVVQSIRDITDRKKAEQKLRRAHHQMTNIIEHLPDATFVIDENKKVIAWNRAIENMTGTSKEDIIGMGDYAYSVPIYGFKRPVLADLVFSRDYELEATYDNVQRRGDTIYAEVFVPFLHEGEGAHVWIKASPVLDEEGQVKGAIESIRDITDRKRTEIALKESEERYRGLVELSPEAIGIHSEGKFVYMNSVGIKLHGANTFEELAKQPLMDYIHPDYRDVVDKQVRKSYENKLPRDFSEEKIIRRDGSIVDIEVASVPITHEGKAASLFAIRDITERKQMEENLKELADISEKLIEISNPMLFVIDAEKKIHIWNRAAEEMTGYRADEVMEDGDFWMNIFPDSLTKEVTLSTFEEIEKDKTVIDQRTRIRTRSGEERVMSWNGLKLEDCAGGLVGIVITAQDVTEQVKMEEEIRSEKELSRSIIQGTDFFITSLETNWKISLFNKGAENMTGYSSEDVLGLNFFDILVPEPKRENFQKQIATMVEENSSEQIEMPILNNVGYERGLLWSWNTIRTPSGELERIIGFGQDMSYNQWLEEQVLLFMDAIESSNDGIAIFDKIGQLLFANPALLDMYGFSLNEIRGRIYSDFVLEAEEISNAGAERNGWRGVITCIKKGGATFPAAVSFAPVAGRENEFVAFVAIVRDISKTVNYERKLESLNQELQSFAYTISHDLRAPLRGIQGFSEVLLEDFADQLDETGKGYLERVVKIAANMDRLILDLLDYSRIGRIVGPPEEIKVERLVKEAYEEVQSLADDREVKFQIEGDFPTIIGEKSRIKQIFTNLLSNSLKYTENAPTILVKGADQGDRYEFSVQDNGTGFDMTYHDRIFEPFYRLSRTGEGTGIGLAIVKKIVEAIGGKIWAESDPEEGSTFHFTMPKKDKISTKKEDDTV